MPTKSFQSSSSSLSANCGVETTFGDGALRFLERSSPLGRGDDDCSRGIGEAELRRAEIEGEAFVGRAVGFDWAFPFGSGAAGRFLPDDETDWGAVDGEEGPRDEAGLETGTLSTRMRGLATLKTGFLLGPSIGIVDVGRVRRLDGA